MARQVTSARTVREAPRARLMNGAQVLMEALRRQGVEVIFGHPGGASLPIYDAIYDHDTI
ncbi:MAG: thiamine pyrophosphate-binding protein, partial [Armatimonadota bacterium]|nr:thiamine pyrophosphate-binding protein [Armatimonadota bacterium]